jgi:hypothetical protein
LSDKHRVHILTNNWRHCKMRVNKNVNRRYIDMSKSLYS